jgi:hypothetical protein
MHFGCEASELRSWNQEEPIQVEASSAKSKTSAAFASLPYFAWLMSVTPVENC